MPRCRSSVQSRDRVLLKASVFPGKSKVPMPRSMESPWTRISPQNRAWQFDVVLENLPFVGDMPLQHGRCHPFSVATDVRLVQSPGSRMASNHLAQGKSPGPIVQSPLDGLFPLPGRGLGRRPPIDKLVRPARASGYRCDINFCWNPIPLMIESFCCE